MQLEYFCSSVKNQGRDRPAVAFCEVWHGSEDPAHGGWDGLDFFLTGKQEVASATLEQRRVLKQIIANQLKFWLVGKS